MAQSSRHVLPGKHAGQWIVKGEQWIVTPRFELNSYLGGGSYGAVVKAVDNETKEVVAVKRIIDCFKGQTHALRVVREIAILRRLRHPNIIQLVDVLDPPPKPNRIRDLYVVFEYAGTDIQQLAKSSRVLSVPQIQFIAKQLLYSVGFLHESSVIHRDLKPANVLINPETLVVKLADFGLARVLAPNKKMGIVQEEEEEMQEAGADGDAAGDDDDEDGDPPRLHVSYTEHVVTRWYRAPEVILSHGLYTQSIDVWSVGCIIAELFGMANALEIRRPLFPGRSCFPLSPTAREDCYRDSRDQLNVIFGVIGTPDDEAIKNLHGTPDVTAYLHSLPHVAPSSHAERYPKVPAGAHDLLTGLIHFDAYRRTSISQALQHPFMESAEPQLPAFPSAGEAMMRMDLEHRVDRKDMIKSLENIMRNEIARMHADSPMSPVASVDEDDYVKLVRIHSTEELV